MRNTKSRLVAVCVHSREDMATIQRNKKTSCWSVRLRWANVSVMYPRPIFLFFLQRSALFANPTVLLDRFPNRKQLVHPVSGKKLLLRNKNKL